MFGSKLWKSWAGVALVAGIPVLAQGAVVAPYDNDFTSSASDFTTSTADGGWTLNTGGTGTLEHAGTSLPVTAFTAGVEVSNLGAAATTDFVVSGRYTATAGAGTSSFAGMVALADTASLSNTYYLVRQRMSASTNNLQIFRVVGGTLTNVLQMNAERLDQNFGEAHELVLSATYVDTDSNGSKDALDLVVTLKNLDDGTQWTSTAYRDTSPLTGQFFGMRDSNANANANLAVAWDALGVSVIPEPALLGLMTLGLGLACLPARARRQSSRERERRGA